jgi:competence protein ComEA
MAHEPSIPRQEKDEWVVYITGEVRRPGIYRLPAGARLFQLVDAAGGLNDRADPVAVNMASPLEDALHVHVPAKQDPSTGEPARSPASLESPNGIRSRGQQTRLAHGTVTARPANGSDSVGVTNVVNVNRASEEELISLKGIGPVLARNIMRDRQENGPFRTLEDLLRVKGIGPKKLEGLRGHVTVGP